ncbi:Haloacid dehalogenase domain-containing protein hydrolase [Alkalidesulfovibrio alkalitolerans DSM 16529]|jgi:phosphoglycolate phosphatase-like HAD superfamily hydrolase|uniref:phosphoglycolate phosphatase n=1 Tax=Alkalidesulfovibrio alkalitolerans DSM 16529 TaxID=1121439 RepID=S7T4N5_9BACT|nr:HAD family hydrolase [Alkalidesulfovibrio alkalitolerans]EPR31581.1 Haloacid dehalogenase domain-containing protein hydrolase [Alkalidesulfovibrio alkalitolerans DSM 16529]
MIECVVLDCDGVILETVELKTEAFAKSARHLGPEAVRTLIDFHRAHGGVSRYEKYRHLWREVFGREISDAEMADMVDRFIAAAADALVECPLVPGVLDFLNEWSARLPLYVASGAPDEELKYILKVKNLSSHFKGIHGSPTPKAELLAAIVACEGVAPERTLMVGDSGTDLDAARRVGTLFYGRGPFPPPLPWGEDLRGLSAFVAEHAAPD